MSKFSIEHLPKEDLQALGLFQDGQLKLDQKNTDILLSGRVTPLMRLDDIKVDGLGIKSLDAKLSLQQKEDGTVGLYVHPIFKEQVTHPNLTPEENHAFSRGGVHEKQAAAYGKITDFGAANYLHDDKNKPSYFVEIEKFNGEKTQIWGVDLERALRDSGKGIGDAVQLEFKGREFVQVEIDGKYEQKERYTWDVSDYVESNKKSKSTVFEFDKETNSFVAADPSDIIAPEEINGMPLSEEQKKKMKKGQVVDLPDGTSVQASPANAKNGFLESNRKLLIASVLLDGGMSFVLIKGIQLITDLMNRKKNENQEYNKGYRDALAKVQADLESKSKQYPNNKEILDDLNTVKGEFNRTATSNTYNDAEEKNINETKAVVNDPELDDNAERKQKELDYDLEQDLEEEDYEQKQKSGRGR